MNATLREFNQKEKHCVEISASVAGKKGMKKYVFAFEKEADKVRVTVTACLINNELYFHDRVAGWRH